MRLVFNSDISDTTYRCFILFVIDISIAIVNLWQFRKSESIAGNRSRLLG